jgi:HEAT repeat protein
MTTPMRSRNAAVTRLAGGLMLVLPVAYFAALAVYGLNIDDEGTLLYQIYRTYLGQLLYVDFHAGYTPGLFYWNAGLYALFGVNVVVLRLCLALINGLSVYCMYWLARRLGAGALSAATAGFLYVAFIPFFDGQFAAFNIPYPIWYVTLFWLLGVICAVRWWDEERGGWWLPAGLCAGVVFAFKPNSGLLNLAGLLIALVLLERPAGGSSEGNVLLRFIQRRERTVRWLIPLGLTVALSVLFGRGAGRREVFLFALPLILVVGCQLLFRPARAVAREVSPFTLWRNLVLLAVGFAVVTVPWTVYFWSQLGTVPFLRAVLFIGTGFDRFYYIAYPAIGVWGVALSLGLLATLAVGLLVRRRMIAPRVTAAALAGAGVCAAFWLLRHPPPMVEGFQSSVVMRVRDVAFVVVIVVEWAALAAYLVQTWLGRTFSVAVAPELNGAEVARFPKASGVLVILLLSGVLMHMQLYPRTDFMHLVVAVPGVLILGAWLLDLLAQVWARGMARSPARRAVVAAMVVAPAYILATVLISPALGRIAYLARAWWAKDATATVTLDHIRAPLVLEPAAAQRLVALNSTASYLRQHSRPDDFLFTFPMLDIVCFLSDRQNPTRHGYFFPRWPGHDVEAEVVDALRQRPPRYIVTLHDHPLYFDSAPAYYFNLRRYVTANYSLERRFGSLDILRLGAARAPRAEDEDPLAKLIELWRMELRRRGDDGARRADAALAAMPAPTVDALAWTLGDLAPGPQRVLVELIRKSRSRDGAAAMALVLENNLVLDTLHELFLRVIAECGDVRAVGPLAAWLKTASGLDRIGISGTLFWITNTMLSEDYWFGRDARGEMLSAARQLEDEDVIRWMDRAPAADIALRYFAVRIAGYRDDRTAIPFLVRILGDAEETSDLRVQAAASLVRLGFGSSVLPAIVRLVGPDTVLPAALTVAVYPERPDVGSELLGARMVAADEETRRTAFWVAAGLRDTEMTNHLLSGLADPVPDVRMAAAWGLGNLGDARNLPALERLATDSNDQVAVFARRAIERLRREGVRE